MTFVASRRGIISSLLGVVLSAVTPKASTPRSPSARSGQGARGPRRADPQQSGSAGASGGTATIEVDPPASTALRITYAPKRDGEPDAGEVVWTWVPYAERDGRGKDRPVLVIGVQDADRVYAVKLTSRSRDGDRDFYALGSGPWDSRGRESWVDIDQIYSVHRDGMRREAAVLDLDRFVRVAAVLNRRYGWAVGA